MQTPYPIKQKLRLGIIDVWVSSKKIVWSIKSAIQYCRTVEANKFYKRVSESPEDYQSLLSPTNNGVGVNGALPLGVAAQGHDNPYSRFQDHALVQINNKIYDPSYGTGPFNAFADWEVASIQSFGALISIGTPATFVLWIEKNNTDATVDLHFESSTY